MYRLAFLTTERLYLCKLDASHCNDNYLGWLHDDEVCKYLETGRYPQNEEDLLGFVENTYKKEALFLAIHRKDNNKHIGNIKIDSINRIHQTAEYGILLGDKTSWGHGFAKEASDVVLRHCFNRLNLRKITLGVISGNVGAVKLYKEKLNFEEEGLLKRHVLNQGKYCDVIRMATFSTQWI